MVGLFNQYGVKGTFHLNSGALGRENVVTREEVKSLYNGHEVSVHTVGHPHLAQVPRERLIAEIMEDRKELERLVGYPIRGMSYPFGTHTSEVADTLAELGMVYARTTASHSSYHLPERFLTWHPTTHHNNSLLERAEYFLKLPYWQGIGLFYVWGHSYEFDHDKNWGMMESICEKLATDSEIWFATNIEIYNYLQSIRQLQFTSDYTIVHNPCAQPVWINVNGDTVKIEGGTTQKLA
ncbi:polysaccharide deacetylase family protein [Paenibacillus roseipurpureus]|uniref:Polysaccharide deacetylase family protein n=1 Tax=Paenibacillus roseopurpureus TaxID=2918901 RepID=A0AA96LL11_9BACL|nr:polysaccharide deacetylase family protein [Paenibacillus sp. MBLB1832]WNR42914.1 polysaccharide deacetylase family protein [Paenibacillus sp. MBLB1832]